ncbi:MAG: hypothetical protein HYW88_01610, partial [Candidatus Sungbacteria bacterium]|nr:hypothetical protein [Candidatus Sungbacteria bacterium]
MIFGHERQWEYLKKVHEKESFAHAYLFSGPAHVGKATLAKEWVKLFLGATPEAREAIDAGRHTDVIYLSKEKPLSAENEGKSIGIDSIRELKRVLGLASYSGGMRFVLVDGAEDMRTEAQNSLLKILEEPPQKTVLILI